MRLIYTLPAQRDFSAIHDYIGQDSPRSARTMLARLVSACEGLTVSPYIGCLGIEPGTRELMTVYPYLVVYEIRAETIDILRVYHGAQNR